jgi:hypothetical protein
VCQRVGERTQILPRHADLAEWHDLAGIQHHSSANTR